MFQKIKARLTIDTVIQWLIYSLAILSPAVFWPGFYSVFSAPKLFILRLITLAILFLWAWKSFMQDQFSYRQSKLNWFLLAYSLVLIGATIFSTNIFSSLFGAETRFLGIFTQLNFLLLLFFVMNFLTTRKELKNFLIITIVTAGFLALYGVVQYFGIFQESFHWSQNPLERAFGTMGHSNHFGAYLGMAIMISFGLLKLIKNKKWRLLCVAAIIVEMISLLLTASRGAFFATLLSGLIMGVIALRSSWQNFKKTFAQKKWLIIMVIVMVGIGFAALKTISPQLPLFERIQNGIASVVRGESIDRVSWWKSSLDMIKDRPFLGFGPSTFRDNYNLYRREDYQVPGDIQDQITPESSHMEYLDIAVQQGIIGIIVYLALIVFILWSIDQILLGNQKKSQEDEETYALAFAVKGAILVYLFQVLVSFGVVDTLTIFYLLLGVAASLSMLRKSSAWVPQIFPNQNKQKNISLKEWRKYPVTFFILIVVALGIVFTVREAQAEISYKNALLDSMSLNFDEATANFEKTIVLQPYRYEYFQDFADFALKNSGSPVLDEQTRKNNLELAIQLYLKTLSINSMHPSTWYNLAVAYTQLARNSDNQTATQKAIDALQQSIYLSPNNPLYTYQSARLFLQLGQKDLAQKAFQKTLKINPHYQDAEKLLQLTF